MLKILHVSFSDSVGGAAIAMNRLHQALKKSGVDSKVLVVQKATNDPDVIGPSNKIETLFSEFKIKLARYLRRKLLKTTNYESFSFNLLSTGLLKKINKIDADIVHLHWIGNEMLSISQIKKIKKPIIWTFWDMWPMCGAEHHSYDRRFIEGYKTNNRPNDEKGIDLNRMIWLHKTKHLDFDFTIIAASKWFKAEIQKSSLYNKKNIIHMPPNINLEVWKPADQKNSKKYFDSNGKKIFLFGSATSTNHRKGFDFLISLFKKKKFENCKLVIFGEKPKRLDDLNIEYEYIGKINDTNSLCKIYSDSDLMLMPSKIEIFGQIGLESNSCGTPCIAFKDTGPTDFIDHKVNGYLSKYLDEEDFANGINWILDKNEKSNELSLNSINNVKNNFDDKIINKKFIEIYKNIIK